MLAGAIAVCWFAGSAPVCTDCVTQRVPLTLDDGTPLAARLYIPPGGGTHLPAVVIVHGYLANSGFVEVPWAADVTHLGMVGLFVDRRGHGRSGGDWWPAGHDGDLRLSQLAPDIRAAVAHLRSRAPLVDPARIALVGHSDGGTGAIMAASADWDVAATVSLSASVAPWEYVNHVAPRDLLLLYGDEDRFILADTDLLLIDSATRGYLHGEGAVGSLADGSARRLLRVRGYGHLDVLFSDTARRTALEWLAGAMGIDREVRLAPLRWHWVVAGLLLLLVLVFAWNAMPFLLPASEKWFVRGGKVLALAALWTTGLALASWVAPRLRSVPVQEGNIVASVLLGLCVCMSAVAIPRLLARRLPGRGSRSWMSDLWRGALAGLLVQLAAEAVLRPVYAFPVTGQRLVLFGVFLVFAIPAFAAVCAAVNWAPEIVRGVPVELALAGITALVATQWFVRMSALPIVLLACTLLFVAAYRAGGRGAISAAAFGAVMYARAASDVCPFY